MISMVFAILFDKAKAKGKERLITTNISHCFSAAPLERGKLLTSSEGEGLFNTFV